MDKLRQGYPWSLNQKKSYWLYTFGVLFEHSDIVFFQDSDLSYLHKARMKSTSQC
jgi:hypothetical protein